MSYIFFKEKSNLKDKEEKQPSDLTVMVKDLKDTLDMMGQHPDEDLFFDVLLKVCRIGCINNLDLEGGLRKKIFAESGRINYNGDNAEDDLNR
ncbi:MAG: hypothetical protein GF375_03875 [Candidatus Omnitrophica bacterium]|nr:hypothetical protein [Candidatus Omnitrophota bacterium]